MILVSVLGVITQAAISYREFKKDRSAYLYDQLESSGNYLSQGLSLEIESWITDLKQTLEGSSKDIDENSLFSEIYIYNKDAQSKWKLEQSFTPKNEAALLPKSWHAKFLDFVIEKPFFMQIVKNSPVIALQSETPQGVRYILAGVKSSNLISRLNDSDKQQNFLVANKKIIISGDVTKDSGVLSNFLGKIQTSDSPIAGVQKIKTTSGEFLVNHSFVSNFGLMIVSILSADVEVSLFKALLTRGILSLIAIAGIILVISILVSRSVTHPIENLQNASLRLASGHLDTRAEVSGSVEVKSLAKGFNAMAERIGSLIGESVEKARMELELKTAQTVQSSLFPAAEYSDKKVTVSGIYEPASECGGDWYFYICNENTLRFWIADATGHGVSAALLTSAARACVAVVDEHASVPEVMRSLNKAIYNVSNGKVQMTAFYGELDTRTGELNYCNASHDTPYLFKNLNQYTKSDVGIVLSDPCPRLGQSLASEYTSSSLQLQADDRIFLFTDGLMELTNAQSAQWGERKVVKAILDELNKKSSLIDVKKGLLRSALIHRGSHPLADDLTFFWIQWHPG